MAVLRKKSIGLLLLAVLIAAIGIGYFVFQSNTDSNKTAVKQETSQKQPKEKPDTKTEVVATGTVITTGDSEFGPMLFDSKGQAIYIWELEDSATAECYGDCADAWPPVLTDGEPIASGSANKELLGTTKRNDGTTQVTYNGHPLYYYAHEKPGEVKCHNIRTHGGLWWVIQPSGIRAN